MTEHLVSWLMMMFSLPFCAFVLYKIRESNYEVENVIRVEDIQKEGGLETAAMPAGHHFHNNVQTVEPTKHQDEKAELTQA